MENISVLIIEDNPIESNRLAAILKENQYIIGGVATSLSSSLELLYKVKVDLIIIDIFLDGKAEGITFAETMNKLPNFQKPFIFLTGSKDRTVFETAKLTHPYSYLLKPFNELELLFAMEVAIENFYEQKHRLSLEKQGAVISSEHLFIKKRNILKKALISDILYIEVEGRYCNVVTKEERFVVLMSLTKMHGLLSDSPLVRTHRNYLVNVDKIERIDTNDNTIILQGNISVGLSEKFKEFTNNFRIIK